MGAVAKVIHQVNHQVRSSSLPRELKVLAREHVPVETKAEFHERVLCEFIIVAVCEPGNFPTAIASFFYAIVYGRRPRRA
jgi:hypothetical protein